MALESLFLTGSKKDQRAKQARKFGKLVKRDYLSLIQDMEEAILLLEEDQDEYINLDDASVNIKTWIEKDARTTMSLAQKKRDLKSLKARYKMLVETSASVESASAVPAETLEAE